MCICFGVTDTHVTAQIDGGARSMREIAASCRAGTDCGRCVKTISAMIPRDDRACDGCTKRCGRICRADRSPAAEPAVGSAACGDLVDLTDRGAVPQPGPAPLVAVPLAIVSADAGTQVA
ncbi:(2Fe-2S)-binding protein [Yinghuangia sp. YIM S09857]|uniref:(2Fe-2S)-binding protein n=1 Tax=Yinghuangia sp. YIM S09857 TaxID=3436929 RepID=UPI003F52B194